MSAPVEGSGVIAVSPPVLGRSLLAECVAVSAPVEGRSLLAEGSGAGVGVIAVSAPVEGRSLLAEEHSFSPGAMSRGQLLAGSYEYYEIVSL